jgi:hypothetical protein
VRRISFTKRNRSGNILHVETDMGIINIHVGLTNMDGCPVEHISIQADTGVQVEPGTWSRLNDKEGIGVRLIGKKEE